MPGARHPDPPNRGRAAVRAVLVAAGFALPLAVTPGAGARAQPACDPGPVPRILGRLQDLAKTADASARQAAIARLLDRWAAGPAIARSALHKRWADMAPADRTRFADLLRRLAAARASLSLSRDGIRKFALLESRPIPPSDCLVASRVIDGRGRPRIVHWRMRTGRRGPRFVDLLVDGVGLTRNLRDELDAILRDNRGDLADLAARLRAAIARAERGGR